MNKTLSNLLCASLLLMLVSSSFGAERKAQDKEPAATPQSVEKTEESSNRMLHRFGVYLGVLGDPFPSVIGGNVAYHVYDFLKVSLGYGSISSSLSGSLSTSSISLSTFGGSARLLIPRWSLSPVAGLAASVVSVSVTGSGSSLFGLTNSGSIFMSGWILGLDYQTEAGFNIGAGATGVLASSANSSGVNPYLTLGYFFNWF